MQASSHVQFIVKIRPSAPDVIRTRPPAPGHIWIDGDGFGGMTNMYVLKTNGPGLYIPRKVDPWPLEISPSQGWMVLGSRPLEQKIIFL